MIISDSKEKQLVTDEGEQILSPVPCIMLVWFSSTVPQTAALNIVRINMRFCVMPYTTLLLYIFMFLFSAQN